MTKEAVKRQLEALLLNETFDGLLEPTVIKANRLGAYAYRMAKGEEKALYKADYLAAAARHQLIKAQLVPLIRAWREIGIDILVMKGFYQAEFVYEIAAERFYGDVDLLMHPEDFSRAKDIAKCLDWSLVWQRESSCRRPFSHEAFHLVSADGQLKLEVHRFPFQCCSPNIKRQEFITQKVWDKAETLAWEATTLKVMQPVDALLVGLVVNRAWAQWGVKPHDLLDMRALIKHHVVSRQQLERRAVHLSCQTTLNLFLRHCDPWNQRLDLSTISVLQRQVYTLRTMRENGYLSIYRLARKLRQGITLLYYVLRVFPAVLKTRRRLKKTPDLYALLNKLSAPGATYPLASVPNEWLALSVKWAAKFAAPFSKGTCVLRSLTLYNAMMQRGDRPVFYSGIRCEDQRLSGHAWIEVGGRPLIGLGDERARHRFKVNFTYPSNG